MILENVLINMNKCGGVLVVEDDTDIRETVQQILESEGYLVHTATNGKEAIEALKLIAEPCLILLDLMMPVMNGWEFLKERQKNNMLSSLPVVVVSAVDYQAKSLTADQVVRKPPDIDLLLKLVSQYCLSAAEVAQKSVQSAA